MEKKTARNVTDAEHSPIGRVQVGTDYPNLDGKGAGVWKRIDGANYYFCECDIPVEEAIKELSGINKDPVKLSEIYNKLNLHKKSYGGIMSHLYVLHRDWKIRIYPNDDKDRFDWIIKYLK